ncbi:hypothetical protein EV363DRAFT_789652 [Boletus edulis]|nr:hypothetical protein EV363DRAFT_789652 [Boletus edulis]
MWLCKWNVSNLQQLLTVLFQETAIATSHVTTPIYQTIDKPFVIERKRFKSDSDDDLKLLSSVVLTLLCQRFPIKHRSKEFIRAQVQYLRGDK